jgi:hypothetical protein
MATRSPLRRPDLRMELPRRSIDTPYRAHAYNGPTTPSGHSIHHGRIHHAASSSRMSVNMPASPMIAPSSVSSLNGSPPPSPGEPPAFGRVSMGSMLLSRRENPNANRKSSHQSLKRSSIGSILRSPFQRSSQSGRSTPQPGETPPSVYNNGLYGSSGYDEETMCNTSERYYGADIEDEMEYRNETAYVEDDLSYEERILRFERGPLDLHFETLAGQKHVYQNGVTLNEDFANAFDIQVGNRWARCFYIADGHGEVIDKRMVSPGYVSYGRHFVELLDQVLPDVVYGILEAETNNIIENGDDDIVGRVATALNDLHTRVNEAIADLDPDVCAENGSTLCLGIIYLGHLFCCSIGDSSMFMADQDGLPLRVWCRRGKDNVLSVCSFEDTLDMYPVKIRQGQNLRALRRDFVELQNRVKSVREMGCDVYLVVSDRSSYALRMTNTLGK